MRCWTALAVLMLAASAAAVTSEFEADSLYQTADSFYKSGDYENALKSAHLSRRIYEDMGNSWGVDRANALINNIESMLSKKQLADTYYNIAGDYFLQTHQNPEIMDRAVNMAGRAKSLYEDLGDSSGVLKCEDLIERANNRIDAIFNQCVKEGDQLYQDAQSSFFLQEYVDAREYALSASEKYASCPYQQGMDRTDSLLSSINAKIREIKINAQASYDKAIDYLAEDDYERCKEYAASSQRLFQQIEDDEGITSATSLLTRCNRGIVEWEEDMVRQAESCMAEARTYSIIPNCLNATEKVSCARDIYQELYSYWREREKGLSAHLQVKTGLYQSYLSEVNALSSSIDATCGEQRMLGIAEDFYRQSQGYYLENDLNEAMSYANKARELFVQFQRYVGISKVDSLIAQIEARMRQRTEADSFMKNAESYYTTAAFEDALIDATKARTIYSNMKDEENIQAAAELIERINNGSQRLDAANGHYSRARSYLESGDYRNALEYARQAESGYSAVNYTLGVAESQAIIEESREALAEDEAAFRNTLIIIGFIALVAGFLIIQFMRRRRMMEMQYEERKAEEEALTKRRDEEWALRREDETKTQVEDELRKLIEDERSKAEGP